MKSLLFVVNEAGEFVELRRVALGAKEEGYEVSFLFVQPGYINLKQDRVFCRLHGFKDYFPGKKYQYSLREQEYMQKEAMLQEGYLPNSMIDRFKSRSKAMRWALLGFLLIFQLPLRILDSSMRFLKRVKKLRDTKRTKPFLYARSLFEYIQPNLVVFGQEFPGSANALLTKLCNQQGIPTLIVPFAVGTTKEMVESLADKPSHYVENNIINRIVALLYPQWVNYYAGKALLRLPGKNAIIIEALGLAPEHPWLPNNSKVTCIAVESPEMERYYRRMQFPQSQLKLTGAAYDDRLAENKYSKAELKQKLSHRLRINAEKPLLVCAWPTDQFGSRLVSTEFNNYKQLCQSWAKALSLVARSTEFSVVIRPHPVTNPDFLADILRPYRLHHCITDVDTLELVPICDLFVACVSSTLRWAIACGIPAINYDCYDYSYTDFDSAKGVFTVNNYTDFNKVLLDLTEDPTVYAEARRKQEECSAEWGLHDGQSIKRILKVIDDLTEDATRTTVTQTALDSK